MAARCPNAESSAMDEDKKTAIERWLIKADNDLNTARLLVSSSNPITDTLCFHSQQAVEKALKAFLTFKDRKFGNTHDILQLLNLCGDFDKAFAELKPLLASMTSYAVVDRYPGDWREILLPEAKEAFEKAEKVMRFVKGKIIL